LNNDDRLCLTPRKFLLAYQNVISPPNLASSLCQLGNHLLSKPKKEEAHIIRLLQFIKTWMTWSVAKENFWEDENVFGVILNWISQHQEISAARSLLHFGRSYGIEKKVRVEKPFSSYLPKRLFPTLSFDDLHPLEIARQMTIMTLHQFRSLRLCDFANMVET